MRDISLDTVTKVNRMAHRIKQARARGRIEGLFVGAITASAIFFLLGFLL